MVRAPHKVAGSIPGRAAGERKKSPVFTFCADSHFDIRSTHVLSPFLIGRTVVREHSWEYSANIVLN